MKIEIRDNKAMISGYVNAVARDSRPIMASTGKFVEMIEPGTFREALERAKNVDVLLNHNSERKLGSTTQGNLKLKEDNIGLYAEFETDDAEVITAARKGELRGWSFGMYVNEDEMEERANNIPRRHVKKIDLEEVSIIDKRKIPCYAGTSVECRADDTEVLAETRAFEDSIEVADNAGTENGDNKREEWEKRVDQLKAEGNFKSWQEKVDTLKNVVK